MIIESLYIKNFNNIKEMFLEFCSRTNLFSAVNGQGKSSIFEAITYVLTDFLNEKISEYVRRGEEQFELKMIFTHQGNKYDYSIIGTIKGASKELIINDSEVFTNSEATKKIASIINPKLTLYSAIAQQDKNIQLLSDTPTNRLKRLKEILGADKLELVVEDIKNDIKTAKSKSDVLKKDIEKLESIEFVYHEIPDLEDISTYELLYEELQKEKLTYDSLLSSYNTYCDSVKKYEENEKKKETIKQDIVKCEKEIEKLKKISYESNLEVIVKELQSKELEYQKLKIEQDNIVKKQEDYLKDKKELEDNKNYYEKQYSEIKVSRLPKCSVSKEAINKLEKGKQKFQVELKQIENNIELAKQGKCPTCGSIWSGSSLNELIEEQKRLQLASVDVENKIKDNKAILEDYDKKVRDNDLNIAKRNVIQKELDSINNKISSLIEPEKLDTIVDYNTLVEESKKQLVVKEKELKEKQEQDKKIESLQNDIVTNNKVLESLSNIQEPTKVEKPKDFDEVQFENVKKILKDHNEKVKEVERLILHNDSEDKRKEQTKQEIKEKRKEYEGYQKNVSIWEESKNVLDKEFSAYLINKGSEFIKEQMNEFFQKTYDKYEITFEQTKNSIGFYYSDEKGVSPCSKASGWEKSIMSVAFRVALCPLQGLNLLLLDEVDSASYPENSLRFYKILLDTLEDNQFFVISHKDETKEYISNTKNVRVFEIEDGMIKEN